MSLCPLRAACNEGKNSVGKPKLPLVMGSLQNEVDAAVAEVPTDVLADILDGNPTISNSP
jgi:hypothetical protein